MNNVKNLFLHWLIIYLYILYISEASVVTSVRPQVCLPHKLTKNFKDTFQFHPIKSAVNVASGLWCHAYTKWRLVYIKTANHDKNICVIPHLTRTRAVLFIRHKQEGRTDRGSGRHCLHFCLSEIQSQSFPRTRDVFHQQAISS